VDFAARVKKAIAGAGGLVDLEWDGELKRHPVKKEMREKQQERYSRRIKSSGVHLEKLGSVEENDERSVVSEPPLSSTVFTVGGTTPVITVNGMDTEHSPVSSTSDNEEQQLQQNGTGLVKRHKIVENGDQSGEDSEE